MMKHYKSIINFFLKKKEISLTDLFKESKIDILNIKPFLDNLLIKYDTYYVPNRSWLDIIKKHPNNGYKTVFYFSGITGDGYIIAADIEESKLRKILKLKVFI